MHRAGYTPLSLPTPHSQTRSAAQGAAQGNAIVGMYTETRERRKMLNSEQGVCVGACVSIPDSLELAVHLTLVKVKECLCLCLCVCA